VERLMKHKIRMLGVLENGSGSLKRYVLLPVLESED
jgi:hypothetical protein